MLQFCANVYKAVSVFETWCTMQAVQKNKLRGPYTTSELYRLSDCHLLIKFSANFCG
jgi:hypothetical protein